MHIVSLEAGSFITLGKPETQLAKTVGSLTAGELEIACRSVGIYLQRRAHRRATVLGVMK